MKITSPQINALVEITADTQEPIFVNRKQDATLVVKIGKGKRAVKWRVFENGHSIPVASSLKASKGKAEPDAASALSLAHKAATEAGAAELRKTS